MFFGFLPIKALLFASRLSGIYFVGLFLYYSEFLKERFW
jgi:hypothetical protein